MKENLNRYNSYSASISTGLLQHSFGMLIKERSFSSAAYKYGFNGKEKDNEINVDGGDYDYGARIYDGRLGRWLSLDPLQQNFSYLNPYNFCKNNPLIFLDNNGKGAIAVINKAEDSETKGKGGTINNPNEIVIKMNIYYNSKAINSNIPENSAALESAVKDLNSSAFIVKGSDGLYYNVKFDIKVINSDDKTEDELIDEAHKDVLIENKIGTDQKDYKTYGNVAKENYKCKPGKEAGHTEGIYTSICAAEIINKLESAKMNNSTNRNLACEQMWKHEIGHLLGLDDKYHLPEGGIMKMVSLNNPPNGTVEINYLEKFNVQIMVDNILSGKGNETPGELNSGWIKQVLKLPEDTDDCEK